MLILKGKGIYGGIATGKLKIFRHNDIIVSNKKIDDPNDELDKFKYAKEKAIAELQDLYDKNLPDLGRDDCCIFLIQQMIIDDIDFNASVENIIVNEHYGADYAVVKTAKIFFKEFSNLESEYIKGRLEDIKDVSVRLLKHILNNRGNKINLLEKAIICSDYLMPSETVGLDKSKVVALCTSFGSATSHTAILAETMNIPAVMGIGSDIDSKYDNAFAAIDGYGGVLYIEPDENTLVALDKKKESEAKKREMLKIFKGRKSITLDKTEAKIYANISGISDIENVIENDGEGIGLFRSEFLYLEKDELPDEEYQFYCYRCVAELMKGKRVVIRTLDAGADKSLEYLHLPKEDNPALGMRSIRLCLEYPDILMTQLRAIYRASAYGNIAVLLPMITDLDELRQVKTMIKQVKQELDEKKIKYSDSVELGVMIETPAAVMISDLLAKEADFFSIGTNDLEQYTLAIDRQDSRLEQFCPPHHLPLLRMIKLVCENAKANGITTCICGELGSDISLTEIFLDMGIDSFSVNPSEILPLRRKIRTLNLSNANQLLKSRNII